MLPPRLITDAVPVPMTSQEVMPVPYVYRYDGPSSVLCASSLFMSAPAYV